VRRSALGIFHLERSYYALFEDILQRLSCSHEVQSFNLRLLSGGGSIATHGKHLGSVLLAMERVSPFAQIELLKIQLQLSPEYSLPSRSLMITLAFSNGHAFTSISIRADEQGNRATSRDFVIGSVINPTSRIS